MQSAKQLYLDLLKRCLSNVIYQDPSTLLGEARPFDLASRVEGRDWPSVAHTMIGSTVTTFTFRRGHPGARRAGRPAGDRRLARRRPILMTRRS